MGNELSNGAKDTNWGNDMKLENPLAKDDEAFSRIMEKLQECAKIGYDNPAFLEKYKCITGEELLMNIPLSVGKKQFVAGAYLMAAYFTICTREGPDARMNKFWNPFLSSQVGKITGLQDQLSQLTQFVYTLLQDRKRLFAPLAEEAYGELVEGKVLAIQIWILTWLGSRFAYPRDTVESAKALGLTFNDSFVSFLNYFEKTLDDLYGKVIVVRPEPRPASPTPSGCVVPLFVGVSAITFCMVILFCFSGLMVISGCGPSESQVQKDFDRMASRRGIPISGSVRVNKMRRVRVDGERKEVWSVNYDVPNADGTKTWKRSYMTYENGKPKVIRTDTQGWVR